jgi:hypothetical protein
VAALETGLGRSIERMRAGDQERLGKIVSLHTLVFDCSALWTVHPGLVPWLA